MQANPVTQAVIQRSKHDYTLYQSPIRSFGEFEYKAGTWLLPQRVVVKAEYTAKGELIVRFIVTNIKNTTKQDLYERSYCGQGCDELFIRQFKEGVNGDSLSCHTFLASRLRIFLYAAAYMLMHSVREKALRGTILEKASILSIREKLMLYAVSIRILKKRMCVDFAKHNPMNAELAHALQYYSNGNSS